MYIYKIYIKLWMENFRGSFLCLLDKKLSQIYIFLKLSQICTESVTIGEIY